MIDASGKYVLPGLIDCHFHVGPESDDWKTAPAAAARTGLTTLVPFVIYDEGETLPEAVVRLREARPFPRRALARDARAAHVQ